jgi:hypothetical protein
VGTGGIFSRGSLTITGSTIALNVGGTYGGGLYTDANATLYLSNSTVTGNRAATYGGGIRSFGTTTIVNSTISGNSAGSYGGGIDNPGGTAISLTNTILAHNQVDAGGLGPDCSGALTDGAGHNLLGIGGAGSNCTYTPGPSDQAGTPTSPLDPMLGSLADNGGPTQTMALLPGSPAMDGGDDGTCSGPPINDLDQRGAPRPFGSHCDIGAFERMAIPLAVGWNLLDLPTSDPTLTSLGTLATTLNSQVGTGTVQAEATYASGRFVLYVPGYSADSPLSSTSGIFVLGAHPGTWNGMRSGSGTSFYSVGQPVNLHPGWNLVGAPFPYQGLQATDIAKEIDPACGAPPCRVQEIAMYGSGSYQTYMPGGGGTNFGVPATSGLWIQMSAATTWTPF